MQKRRTHRFRPADSTPVPTAPAATAAPAAPAGESAPPVAAGVAARERPRRPALGGKEGRAWRVAVLVVIAAVAFRPRSAFCQFVVEEHREAAVAAGFARGGGEVVEAWPWLWAEAGRTRTAFVSRESAGPVTDAAGQTLIVDQSVPNSPYAINASDTFDTMEVGTTGVGVINQSANTLTVTGTLYLGYPGGSSTTTTGNGTYNLSGGTLATGSTQLGNYGTGTFVQTGGMHMISGALYLGLNNGTGTYNLGGTGNLSTGGGVAVGSSGNGIFNQTGGTFTNANSLFLGYNSGSQGAYNLNGGLVNTPGVTVSGGAGTLNFNGGTLQASASASNFFFGAAVATNVRNGGAVIDTNGNNVTFNTVLAHSALGTPGSTGTIGNAGSGYTSAPTVTVTGGGGYGAAAVATINAQGQVTGVTLTNPGTNYTGAPTFTFSGGGGTGATATDPFTADNATDGGLTKLGAGTLTLTGTNTYTGQTSVTAGTLAIPSGVSIGVTGGTANLFVAGTAANAPTLNVSGGSVTAGVVRLGNNTGEVGTITQSAGTVTINGSNGSGQGLFVGYNVNDTGLYTLTGGSLVLNSQSSVGTFGNGTFNQSGGTVAVNVNNLILGLYNGGSGTYNLSGTGSLSGGAVIVGGDQGNGMGFLHQTGGIINLSFLQIGQNAQGSGAMGTYTLDAGTATAGTVAIGVNTSSTGTVNLNGGTLTAGHVVGQAGTSTFRFNGGTLQASGNSSAFVSGLTNAYVGTGGAVINTNGFNVTVPQALTHDTALGTTADGGLTKVGTGVLTLSVANTYTGTTAVNAGTLAISSNGGLGKGNVTIAAGGTLTLAAGVTAAHNASTGTTLTLAATSTINLNATTAGTIQDTVGAIVIAGVSQLLPGTYGSATSGAAHIFPEFTGKGEVLLTAVPEPGTWALLGVGTLGLGLAFRCRVRAA